jgi:UDP-glucuronate decarboxylase
VGGSEERRVRVSLDQLRTGDERFAVTGASGWLGRTALDVLARAMGDDAFLQRVTGFASAPKEVVLRSGLVVPLRPLKELRSLDPAPTHLVHLAYQTRNRVAELGLGPYILANVEISSLVLGALQRHRPRGVFVASSGAVYAPEGGFVTDVVSNPYGSLKYQEELLVRRAAGDIGARSVVARVFSVAGAYITKPELYALGELIMRALAGVPLTLRARGPVVRSYCAAADLLRLGILALLNPGGGSDEIFDSGGTVVEVGELAEQVTSALGVRDLPIERATAPDVAVDRYVGNVDQMAALASGYGIQLQSLSEQILDTAAYLQQVPGPAAPG